MERGFQLLSSAAFVSCLTIASSASACSCAVGGSFEDISGEADTIVRARVLEHVFPDDSPHPNTIPTAMQVEVLEQVKGEVEGKQIVIAGDNGMLCRPYVSQFPVDTEWLFVIGPDFHSSEDEWAISVCGEHWKRLSPLESKETVSKKECGMD